MLAPGVTRGLRRQGQVAQSIVDADAVLVDDLEARGDAAAVPLPQHVLDELARVSAELVFVGVGEDGGSAAVPVDLHPGLEGEVVHQADVSLVQ